ncbi:hypothetical protein, partial [Roseibium sp. RKSG952]|uniref:hypothetical protein n=1 Tax=Roseibium sp. RKSG952 TaxID=2529384 RepID=UPI0018AD1081
WSDLSGAGHLERNNFIEVKKLYNAIEAASTFGISKVRPLQHFMKEYALKKQDGESVRLLARQCLSEVGKAKGDPDKFVADLIKMGYIEKGANIADTDYDQGLRGTRLYNARAAAEFFKFKNEKALGTLMQFQKKGDDRVAALAAQFLKSEGKGWGVDKFFAAMHKAGFIKYTDSESASLGIPNAADAAKEKDWLGSAYKNKLAEIGFKNWKDNIHLERINLLAFLLTAIEKPQKTGPVQNALQSAKKQFLEIQKKEPAGSPIKTMSFPEIRKEMMKTFRL